MSRSECGCIHYYDVYEGQMGDIVNRDKWTYCELHKKANELERSLKSHNVFTALVKKEIDAEILLDLVNNDEAVEESKKKIFEKRKLEETEKIERKHEKKKLESEIAELEIMIMEKQETLKKLKYN